MKLMKPMKIDGEIAIWRMVFAALIIAVVCDGVGGQDLGEVASKLGAETVSQEIAQRISSLPSSKASTG